MSENEKRERLTLGRWARAEMTERKSLFIGTAAPVSSEAEAKALVDEVRREYHDATHNVFAYLLSDGAIARYSDDGEPQGTAGVPVLNVLKMSGATDLCVVVTRYFGGILLGAGGLVRAYSASAKQAIDEAMVVRMVDFAVLQVRVGYSDYQKLTAALPKMGITEDDAEFTSDVTLRLGVLHTETEAFLRTLAEMTGGRATVEHLGFEERSAPIFEKK